MTCMDSKPYHHILYKSRIYLMREKLGMAFSAGLSHASFSGTAIFRRGTAVPPRSPIRVVVRAVQSAENEKKVADSKADEPKPPPAPAAAARPKKPVYSSQLSLSLSLN